MKFSQAVQVAGLTLLSTVSAHMKLEWPVPYSFDSLDNGPLLENGANYPCKMREGGYKVTKENSWSAGETRPISFIGSAVHGGGSCQFSVTTDLEPTKESQFKVIHSIIGGCPSNVTGNLPEDENGHGAAVFDVTLPADMPNGQFTFAWTWFNKVGNREMYMNCAPITVTGGGDDTSALAKLPDMFVVNIPPASCSIPEGADIAFPQPGESVDKGDKAVIGSAINGAACASVTAMGAGNGQLGSPAQGSGGAPESPAATDAPATTTAAAPSTTTKAGGEFAPGPSSDNKSPTSFQTIIATTTAATQPSTTAVPQQPAPEQPAGGSGGASPCDSPGAIVCFGTTQFGICDGQTAVPQAVAQGMVCQDGAVVGASRRRHAAHRRRGVHGRL